MKKLAGFISVILMVFATVLCCPRQIRAAGETADQVSIADIDYEKLQMRVYKNGNDIIYYSADKKKTWNEVEGSVYEDATAGSKYILMDISWTPATAASTVYFKGDKNIRVISVTFPKQNTGVKVKFDKVYGDFEFKNCDDAKEFYWRKSTDYSWREVPLNTEAPEYRSFLTEIDRLRFKGSKVYIRTGQIIGESESSPGERPSKEVMVTISKRAAAPSVKLNVQKMTLNTRDTMEYCIGNGSWTACEKNMTVEDIAPEVLYTNESGAKDISVKLRVAATEKKPYSQTGIITIRRQGAQPSIGDSSADVTTYYVNSDLMLTFTKASATTPYEYAVVKSGDTFEAETAKWRTVKNTKPVKLKNKTAPSGTVICVRVKGVNENVNKKIAAKLPSHYNSFTVQ